MRMGGYWGKIALKALGIFAVGMVVLSVARDGKRQVVRAVETNADLTIPLPFLPFNFDGERLGTFRKIVLHRSTPDAVESVDLTVRVSDPISADRFDGCPVTVEDPTRLNERSSFQCAAEPAGMTEFGRLLVYARADGRSWRLAKTVPLMLPSEMTRKIQGRDAQLHASQLERDRFQELADSLRTLADQLVSARDADARDAVQARMEELESEMSDLRQAIVDAAREQAAEAAAKAESAVRVEVAPRVKVVVEAPAPPR